MKTDRPNLEQLIVTVRDEALHRIDEVARLLKENGFEVSSIARVTGVISGMAPRTFIARLLEVEGVEAVEVVRDLTSLSAPPLS